MKSAKALTLLPAVVFCSVTACSYERWDADSYSDSEIVFGISQAKGSNGTLETSVGYDFIDVRSQRAGARGQVTRDRSCWAENLADRLGKPRVEGGVAIFQGAALPPGGIAVIANREDDLTLGAPAWTRAGETLTFEARGFAMPQIRPVRLFVPSTTLTIAKPADPVAEIPLHSNEELEVGWTTDASDDVAENVVASLRTTASGDPSARGIELRCFFDRRAGTGRVPRQSMDRFLSLAPAGDVKGTLRISTHRQVTVLAEGGWTVYVVATVEQREQPFVLRR